MYELAMRMVPCLGDGAGCGGGGGVAGGGEREGVLQQSHG